MVWASKMESGAWNILKGDPAEFAERLDMCCARE